ncbi:hypothetical protein ACVIN2_004891 [Bradyrhizobium sp. USDA 3650]
MNRSNNETDELTDELGSVSGGNQISIVTKLPNYQGPKSTCQSQLLKAIRSTIR